MEPPEDDDDNNNKKKGLSTPDALMKLSRGISEILKEHEALRKRQSKLSFVYNILHHSSDDSLLCWISVSVLILEALLMIVTSFIESNNSRFQYVGLQGATVLLLVIFNFGFVLWDRYLCTIEVAQRVRGLVKYIEEAADRCDWRPENYPHVCSPYSPCITLQWTYRDGALVNLPWALLVDGDLVLVRPGQPAPGHCTASEENDSDALRAGEVYSPVPSGGSVGGQTPQEQHHQPGPSARRPLPSKEYTMLETPFLRNLRLALNDHCQRPPTLHDRSRRLLVVSSIEHLLLPFLLVCMVGVGVVRLVYVGEWVSSGGWAEVLVTLPVAASLPLLPLIFPCAWLLIMCYGNARLSLLLHSNTNYNTKRKQQMEGGGDPFDETEVDGSLASTALDLAELKPHFINELMGRGQNLTRSSNILHALGSVTSLCCVDKKGILSWPNPTAEKIFFLRKKEDAVSSPSASSVGDVACSSDTGVESASNNESTANRPDNKGGGGVAAGGAGVGGGGGNEKPSQMQAEVLDLTHDHSCAFRLQFDDALWTRHLDSLKPLGLAVLLNTCNMATQDHYTQFCSHVTCEALYNDDLVPVTNRRLAAALEMSTLLSTNKCLCEVAKQIGFSDRAVEIFHLESQLSTFRHVEPESVRNDMRFAKSLPPSTKLKFPFPHMVAVVVRDLARGGLQLFSQGTADIVLDSCTQYWDGDDLCRLSPADRRKVQDFYQRTSLSAYCTAFAYRPLFNSAAPSLSSIYMELPTDSQHLYRKHNRPVPIAGAGAGGGDDNGILHVDEEQEEDEEEGEEEEEENLHRYNSNDSMFEEEDMLEELEVSDIEGCFSLQCNQIFIGMVTMQYQAQADIVQLIEQLERACIRFVHFSKENELRSRVFSEKMGLESGWNCHISLLSEKSSGQNLDSDKRTDSGFHLYSDHQHGDDDCNLLEPLLNCGTLCSSRQMSMSAPCTYKPENENSTKYEDDDHKTRDAEESGGGQQRSGACAVESGASGGGAWQSLSCLTDSTEQSVPVNFDMSNRAKLPRGIDKIRPHIEFVDNVPLLVSLFTDCTPTTTTEMIAIMQDYGEVVCVLGSSVNADNITIFLKANASVAVEPLYPQVCQKVSVYEWSAAAEQRGPSPVEISKQLNSIPCSISMRRNQHISLFHIIKEARNFMMQAWNCTQFWMCCVVSLSCTQLLAATVMLPPLLSTGQVLYLSIVFIPSVSLSLVGTPIDKSVMQRATGKNNMSNSLTGEMAVFVVWCYGAKFLPTVALAPMLFAGLLACYCRELIADDFTDQALSNKTSHGQPQPVVTSGQCVSLVYLPGEQPADSWGGWSQHPYTFLIAQHFVMLLLSVHFITISSSFVHREHLSWRRLPFTNKLWSITSLIILLLSVFYALLALSLKSESFSGDDDDDHFDHRELEFTNLAPLVVLVIALVSPVVVFCVNEFVKWQEIKVNVRYQKRARLEFGTKLGMNSPF